MTTSLLHTLRLESPTVNMKSRREIYFIREDRKCIEAAKRLFRMCSLEQRQGDVEDRSAARRTAFRLAVMRMPVKHGGHVVANERLFEPRGSQERKNLERLTFHGRCDRCVVQHRNPRGGPKPREGGLELQRFRDRFLHERLDQRLAPGTKGARAKTAAESLGAGESNPFDFYSVTIEHVHARGGEDVAQCRLLP